ncbi:MAG: type 2 isopentenyl-diphosphate Delta-isomerase [Candidatus Dormibacteraeota bacterium]|nr:type 2 isopentenyl-diphosphate Delta-isomerase [Candidatus Dormibacteraeota bacterium]MBV9526390.1 type 2 isopentenyl-diphosphate Delta-isomerase [Candidatus Dormibacteraeota bacterium]
MSPNATGREAALEAAAPATVSRKADHIRINLEEDVSAKGVDAGFDRLRFVHCALPEIDLQDVDLSTTFLGHPLRAPLLISCMTGGTDQAQRINTRLAVAAQQRGLAMGLGSCRVLLEEPDVLPTFDMRKVAPDIVLLANLGAVQLNRGVSAEDCKRLLGMLRADALVLHLNPLQEALQPEGDTCFAALLPRIADLCAALEEPVIVKEVGWGISADLVVDLLSAGVTAVDVAGAGGTSWSEVERHRMNSAVRERVAASFAGWGIPTAVAVERARAAAPDATLIASGGVRSGMDVAKAIALGADLAGVAGPLLRTAAVGEHALWDSVDVMVEELRLCMFCVGAASPAALRGTSRLERIAEAGA